MHLRAPQNGRPRFGLPGLRHYSAFTTSAKKIRQHFRQAGLLVVLVLTMFFGLGTSLVQAYTADFDGFTNGTTAEALTIPGLTFSSSPSSTWQITGSFFV